MSEPAEVETLRKKLLVDCGYCGAWADASPDEQHALDCPVQQLLDVAVAALEALAQLEARLEQIRELVEKWRSREHGRGYPDALSFANELEAALVPPPTDDLPEEG